MDHPVDRGIVESFANAFEKSDEDVDSAFEDMVEWLLIRFLSTKKWEAAERCTRRLGKGHLKEMVPMLMANISWNCQIYIFVKKYIDSDIENTLIHEIEKNKLTGKLKDDLMNSIVN